MPRNRVPATAGPEEPPDRRVIADVARRRRNRIILAVATPIGALLFIIGQIGAQTGWISIPGDPHHFLTQVAGFGVLPPDEVRSHIAEPIALEGHLESLLAHSRDAPTDHDLATICWILEADTGYRGDGSADLAVHSAQVRVQS